MANELYNTIHVWITDIKVDEKYYSFKYKVNLNGNELTSSEFMILILGKMILKTLNVLLKMDGL